MDHELFFNKVMEQLPPADGMPLMRAYIMKHGVNPANAPARFISDYGARAYVNGKLNINEPADPHAALEEFLHRNNLKG
jgi:hypothetical protein